MVGERSAKSILAAIKPKKRAAVKKAVGNGAVGEGKTRHEMDEATQLKIAQKAYELYVARGCVNGHHEADWLEAEKLVLKEKNA
jgi:hypothetical protein